MNSSVAAQNSRKSFHDIIKMKKTPSINIENIQNEKPNNGLNLGSLNLSPSDSMYSHALVGPFTITPSNLFMGAGNINTTTAGNSNNPLTASNRTPKGLLTNKPQGLEKGKLILTPAAAYSPMNKVNNQPPLTSSYQKSKTQVVFPKASPQNRGDDGLYHPGMLKVSPNSGFS